MCVVRISLFWIQVVSQATDASAEVFFFLFAFQIAVFQYLHIRIYDVNIQQGYVIPQNKKKDCTEWFTCGRDEKLKYFDLYWDLYTKMFLIFFFFSFPFLLCELKTFLTWSICAPFSIYPNFEQFVPQKRVCVVYNVNTTKANNIYFIQFIFSI